MLQKKICVSLLLLVLVLPRAKSNAQVAISTPEQITGNTGATTIKKQYDEGALTWYAVYSDSKAIYIQLAVTDSLQKSKIVQNGMEVWIDTKGRKNKTTGIMFPLGPKANMYPGGGDRNAAGGPPSFFKQYPTINKVNADSELTQLISRQTEMELKGFSSGINGRQSLQQTANTTVSLQMVHDTLLYDAIIPFSSLPQLPALKGTVAIGIFEKGIQMPGFGGDMDGGPGDDMGGPPPSDGGGMMVPPPGDRDGGDVDIRRLLQVNAIWYKLKLH